MKSLMVDMSFDEKSIIKNLWMSNEDLVNLSNNGHIIGLHSHSHPTNFSNKSEIGPSSGTFFIISSPESS